MSLKTLASTCAVSIVALVLSVLSAPAPASARHGEVTISWSRSQGVSLGDNIKTAARSLGKKATHDIAMECTWYGTFHSRHVTFHTASWPRIDSIWTYSGDVRLQYGIRVGQRVNRAKAKLPNRFAWRGPIKDLEQDFNELVWFAPRSHHRVLMMAAGMGDARVGWAGTFASKQAIESVLYENC